MTNEHPTFLFGKVMVTFIRKDMARTSINKCTVCTSTHENAFQYLEYYHMYNSGRKTSHGSILCARFPKDLFQQVLYSCTFRGRTTVLLYFSGKNNCTLVLFGEEPKPSVHYYSIFRENSQKHAHISPPSAARSERRRERITSS